MQRGGGENKRKVGDECMFRKETTIKPPKIIYAVTVYVLLKMILHVFTDRPPDHPVEYVRSMLSRDDRKGYRFRKLICFGTPHDGRTAENK